MSLRERLNNLLAEPDSVILASNLEADDLRDLATHRHFFSDPEELERLMFAHRTSRNIIVVSDPDQATQEICQTYGAVFVDVSETPR